MRSLSSARARLGARLGRRPPADGPAARGRVPRGVWISLLAGMLVVAVPVLYAVVRPRPQRAATNTHVLGSRVGVLIAPGQNRCQGGEYVPRAASRVLVYAGQASGEGQPLVVTLLRHDGTMVARTHVPGGYRPGPLWIPLPPRPVSLQIGYLCLHNVGHRYMSFAGNLTSDQPEAPTTHNTPYQRPTDEVRADYYYGGRHSYLALAPEIARRATMYSPPFVRPWFLWLSLAVMAALVAAGSLTLTRTLRT